MGVNATRLDPDTKSCTAPPTSAAGIVDFRVTSFNETIYVKHTSEFYWEYFSQFSLLYAEPLLDVLQVGESSSQEISVYGMNFNSSLSYKAILETSDLKANMTLDCTVQNSRKLSFIF